jgi:WbqC-like protein family.
MFTNPVTHLMHHNLQVFEVLIDLLGIDITITKTETYQKVVTEDDYRFLIEAKKEKEFRLDTYIQVLGEQHGFIENLSVLDLLFNEGPNALSYLEAQKVSLH